MADQDPNMKDPQKPQAAEGGWKSKNFFLIFLILGLGFWLLLSMDGNNEDSRISRTEFLALMQDSSVKVDTLVLQKAMDGVIIRGQRILSPDEIAAKAAETPSNPLMRPSTQEPDSTETFACHMLYVTHDQLDEWEKAKNLKAIVMHEETGWITHLFSFLPVLLLIFFFWMIMMRQGGGGGRGVFNFGKSKAKMEQGKGDTTFNDVAGAEEAKQDLQEVVEFLKSPRKFSDLGGRIPKGVLLVGPPGTGKTLLARAAAGEAGVPFFSMSGSDFVEMFVGVGASRVRDLFETGKKHAPCLIFIDEIDAVGRQRGAGLGGGHDEREQTLNQLLVEMDGFAANEGIILLAATNRPDVLDKALLRPGRFDRQVVVNLPDQTGRQEILKVHVNKRRVPLRDDVDLARVAKGTPGLSGADLENLVNEAALLAARFDQKQVSMLDFEEARDKLWMGSERKTLLMDERERKLTAYHEAGHALLNLKLEHVDPLHKISIIPRGRALGVTMSLPEKDKVASGKEDMQDQIALLMGGRAAEILMFDHKSTGASNDIERATDIARRMVTVWGFTDVLGPVAYGKTNEEIFLGREISQHRDYSEQTAQTIDSEVRRIVEEQMNRALQVLEENKDELILLSEALLEHEVIDREEVDRLLSGETLESTRKSRHYQTLEAAEKARRAGSGIAQGQEPPPEPELSKPAQSDAANENAEEAGEQTPPAEPPPEPEKGSRIDKEV
jgi:cell division protease FtsH